MNDGRDLALAQRTQLRVADEHRRAVAAGAARTVTGRAVRFEQCLGVREVLLRPVLRGHLIERNGTDNTDRCKKHDESFHGHQTG